MARRKKTSLAKFKHMTAEDIKHLKAKDAQKRTCAKALVMTHAYSNAVLDKVEEAVKNGIVGNDDDDW